MHLLLELPDNITATTITDLLKSQHVAVKATRLSASQSRILTEIKEITEAKKLAAKINEGKIKTRSAHDFLNEL